MTKRTKSTPKPLPKQDAVKPHKLGDKHFINGVACVTRIVNRGCAWVFPEMSDPDDHDVRRHIAYAVIEADGVVKLI